jgi:hypothetical protein
MKKKDLKKKVRELEARIRELESRPIYVPAIEVTPQPQQRFTYPYIGDVWTEEDLRRGYRLSGTITCSCGECFCGGCS